MEDPIEVEVKIPLKERATMVEALRVLGAVKINSEIQIDEYLDHPSRSFETTDEALRLRSRILKSPSETEETTSSVTVYELTYKGPKIGETAKTRVELSISLDDPETTKSMLKHLGFKQVAVITKNRIFYSIDEIIVSIDDVEGVGLYTELELIVDKKSLVGQAQEELFVLVRNLGFDPLQSVRESYLELYLEKNKS